MIFNHLLVDIHPLAGYNSDMYARRLTSNIENALADTPAVMLTGPRQAGKSTLVQQVAERQNMAYFNLDDIDTLTAAQQDPSRFIKNLPEKAVLDEIQRVPQLLLPIKASIDTLRSPGRFLLTGSANVMLLPQIADSLAGRIEILNLWPLSYGEKTNIKESFIDHVFFNEFQVETTEFLDMNTLLDAILLGGYPEIQTRKNPSRRRAWFKSYATTILQRDVRDLSQVEALGDLPKLLSLLAARCSSLLNFSDLSRSLEIAQTSLKRYFSLLEMIFFVKLLPPWFNNRIKRLVKAPKVLISDSGLLCYLLNLTPKQLLQDKVLFGRVLENFITIELMKQSAWSEAKPEIYHFRTHTGQEVDLVLESAQGDIIGIEIKLSSIISKSDFKGMKALEEVVGNKFRKGIVLHTGNKILPFGENLWGMPISSLYSATKYNNSNSNL